jgi:hypothetical protein
MNDARLAARSCHLHLSLLVLLLAGMLLLWVVWLLLLLLYMVLLLVHLTLLLSLLHPCLLMLRPRHLLRVCGFLLRTLPHRRLLARHTDSKRSLSLTLSLLSRRYGLSIGS